MWPGVLSLLLSQSVLPPLPPLPPPPPPPQQQGFRSYPFLNNEPLQPRPQTRIVKPPPEPLPPARFALFFQPFSLFSLTAWVEGDLHLGSGVSVFLNVGGGPLGQLGGDAGLRYYVMGTPFEGFFLDARAEVFSLPAHRLAMLGPGAVLGYGWRFGHWALSIGLGFTTWYSVSRADSTTSLLGTNITDADVTIFPGFTQPASDKPSVQPTVRVSIGPAF
jgi:hypothetical protein